MPRSAALREGARFQQRANFERYSYTGDRGGNCTPAHLSPLPSALESKPRGLLWRSGSPHPPRASQRRSLSAQLLRSSASGAPLVLARPLGAWAAERCRVGGVGGELVWAWE